ncbi:MAG: hypothetical protein ABI778_04845 [Ignavibacteriota bacterium]
MRHVMVVLLIVAGLAPLEPLFGQVSAAFDPNCYFPRIGVPGEIDTIMGSTDGQGLGSFILNAGTPPGEANANMLIQGLPQNAPFLTAVKTGHSFDLHKLNIRKQLDLDDKTIIRAGHFHDTKHLDLLALSRATLSVPRIYWADDSGNYSKSRVTYPVISRVGDDGFGLQMSPYHAYLTSDTVEDLIMSFKIDYLDPHRDTDVLCFYKGGRTLFEKGMAAKEDTMFLQGGMRRYNIQGDWRGTGREDLISEDGLGNALYYHNDRETPFSLAEFYRALRFDTLFARWQNPHFLGTDLGLDVTMNALPRTAGDKSHDLLLTPSTDDNRNKGIWFFRGGSDFGSHRITLDSAVHIIRTPEFYDPTAFFNLDFPSGIINCGNMTGTGNNVIVVGGGIEFTALLFFYVTGAALDDKVDMYYLLDPKPGGTADTLTADSDNLGDLLVGHFAWKGTGALFLVHGSKEIPVRLTSVREHDGRSLQDRIRIYPNIFSETTTLSFTTERSVPITIAIRDVLGRSVFEEKRYSIGGSETISLRLPLLPSGRYIVQASGPAFFASAPITIIR